MTGFERALGVAASLIAVGTFIWALATTFLGADIVLSFEPQAGKAPVADLSGILGGFASALEGIMNVVRSVFEWASQNIVLKLFFYIAVMLIYAVVFATLFVVPWVRNQEPLLVPTFLSYLYFLGAVWAFDRLFVDGGLRSIAAAVMSGESLHLDNEGLEFSMCLVAILGLYGIGVNVAASVARKAAEKDLDFFERVFKGGGAPAGSWTLHGIAALLMAFAALFTY